MKFTELHDPAAIRNHLSRTGLDIVLSGQTGDSFQAAHSDTESVLVLDQPSAGMRAVWLLTDAPKPERKAKADHIRQVLVEQAGATLG